MLLFFTLIRTLNLHTHPRKHIAILFFDLDKQGLTLRLFPLPEEKMLGQVWWFRGVSPLAGEVEAAIAGSFLWLSLWLPSLGVLGSDGEALVGISLSLKVTERSPCSLSLACFLNLLSILAALELVGGAVYSGGSGRSGMGYFQWL